MKESCPMSTNGISNPAIVRRGMAEALVGSLAPVPNTIAPVYIRSH